MVSKESPIYESRALRINVLWIECKKGTQMEEESILKTGTETSSYFWSMFLTKAVNLQVTFQ